MDYKDNFRVDKDATLTPWEFYAKNKKDFRSYNIFEDEESDEEVHETLKKTNVRPITPINDAIKKPPSDYTELIKCFRSRLRLDDNSTSISLEDQTSLADVLVTAIVSIWPAHRQQGSDPFLNDNGNRELQRRVAVYVVDTAEKLFAKYLERAKDMHNLKIFSADANILRLKTQLLDEASKLLDILRVRRKIAEEMRQLCENEWLPEPSFGSDLVSILSSVQGSNETERKMICETSYRQFIQKQISEIKHQMGTKNSKKKIWFPTDEFLDSLKQIEHRLTETNKLARSETDFEITKVDTRMCKETEEKSDTKPIQRCPSMPELHQNLEDFEEFTNCKELPKRPSINQLSYDVKKEEIKELSLSDDLKKLAGVKIDASSEKLFGFDRRAGDEVSALLQVGFDRRADDEVSALLQSDFTYHQRHRKSLQEKSSKERKPADTDSNNASDHHNSFEKTTDEKIEHIDNSNQPDILNIKVPNFGIVQISDAMITNEIEGTEMSLQMFPVAYNEFLGEISDEEAHNLDQHLFIGDEIKGIYDEITKIVSQEHLQFDKDDYVESCPPETFQPMEQLFSSGMLSKNKINKIMNNSLRQQTLPPWFEYDSADDWRNEPKFSGIGREDILKINSAMSGGKISTNQLSSLITNSGHDQASNVKAAKSYAAWMTWYKNNVDPDDYKKFLSLKETDFLGTIFHIYESEDEEGGESHKMRRKTSAELQALKEMKIKKKEMLETKLKFEQGLWNVNAVSMGGLGRDPLLDDDSPQENETNLLKNEEEISPYVMLQDRIEKVWEILKLSDVARFNMAMKFSSRKSYNGMIQMVDLMENAAILIREREAILTKLEMFEKHASDPNRFFVKGIVGSSISRNNEGTTRTKLEKRIKKIEIKLHPMLEKLLKTYGLNLLYQDREYLVKMQNDKIEMLYWLQQERRKEGIHKFAKENNVPIAITSISYPNPDLCDSHQIFCDLKYSHME